MKKVLGIYGNRRQHWVGNGFPVRSLFSYDGLGGGTSARSCCWITPARRSSSRARPRRSAGSARTRTAVSRP